MIRKTFITFLLLVSIATIAEADRPFMAGGEFWVKPDPFKKRKTVKIEMSVIGTLIDGQTASSATPWAELRSPGKNGAPIAILYYRHPVGWVTTGVITSNTVKIVQQTVPTHPDEPTMASFQGKLVWQMSLPHGQYAVITHGDPKTITKTIGGVPIQINCGARLGYDKCNMPATPIESIN